MHFRSSTPTVRMDGGAGWTPVCVIALACLAGGMDTALAGPTSADQARQAVVGWVKSDASPLGAVIGGEFGDVQTFSDDADGPVYYVVNLKPSGFVVVPADDWVEPIIAFVAEGSYDPSVPW